MTKPRADTVDPVNTHYYHVTSRCVRRAWLLGRDPLTGTNHDHRKIVFLNHLKHLSRFFAVQIMGYAIMSNHFHLVLRYDPTASRTWDDEEVTRRWCAAFNGLPLEQRLNGPTDAADFDARQALKFHQLLLNPRRIQRCRLALGSLSAFMQHLKQPFAVWANHEESCSGHFFDTRFYAGVLLTQADLLACMAYVDLNPVEARMAHSLRQAKHTSIHERLSAQRFDPAKLDVYLGPLWSDDPLDDPPDCTLKHYAAQLTVAVVCLTRPQADLVDKLDSWMARLFNRQRQPKRNAPAVFFDYA